MMSRILLLALMLTAIFMLLGCPKPAPSVLEQEEQAIQADSAAIADSIARADSLAEVAAVREKARQDSIMAAEAEAERARMEREEEARKLAELNRARTSLQNVYFGFDKSGLTSEIREILQKNAEILRQYPEHDIVIEGHCDERGATEYNLALGERRAASIQQYYVDYGIDSNRIMTISYGEERPAVPGRGEDAWAKNRRAVTILK